MPQSLKQASKKAIYKSNVSKLDGLGNDKVSFTTGEGLSAIQLVIGQFIERIAANINSAGIINTGSITDITVVPKDNGIDIVAPAHLVYQSRGVSGTETKYPTPHSYTDKMPPPDVLVPWMKKNGIPEEAKFAIAQSIYRHGIAPKDLYEKEIPQLIEELKKEIADFMVQHINQAIDLHPSKGGGNRIILK